MKIVRVEREVLLYEPEWFVAAAREDGPPTLGLITPSRDLRVNGADLFSLVLPPPCKVEFSENEFGASGLLRLKMGIDRSVLLEHSDTLAGYRIEFRVQVGDREPIRRRIAVEQVGRKPGTEWIQVDCGSLRDSERVHFATELQDANGDQANFEFPLRVGFGGIEIVREYEQARTTSSAEKPNIVLIVMDTLRADRLSTYGYDRPTSPNLDRLAARGFCYDDAYATSNWTWPSTASILTGLHPGAHGLVDENSAFLAQSVTTIAEVLQDSGYSTVGLSANYLLGADRNFDQGFELYRYAEGKSQASHEVMPTVLSWIKAMEETRFFLYLQLIDPHAPQAPLTEGRALLASEVPEDFSPTAINGFARRLFSDECRSADGTLDTNACVSEQEQAWISDLYDACVWSGDYWLGRIMDQLDSLQLTEKTIVVFTSDHGEELFEHGMLMHGQSLHPELTRVPLVLAGPGIQPGVRSSRPISNRHIAPTLARFGGTSIPGLTDPIDLVHSDSGAPLDVFYSTATGWWRGHERTPILGIRSSSFVLHWAPKGANWGEPASVAGQVQLFETDQDPGEKNDLSLSQVELAEALRTKLERFHREVDAQRSVPSIEAGEATLQQLRDVGYLGDE